MSRSWCAAAATIAGARAATAFTVSTSRCAAAPSARGASLVATGAPRELHDPVRLEADASPAHASLDAAGSDHLVHRERPQTRLRGDHHARRRLAGEIEQ